MKEEGRCRALLVVLLASLAAFAQDDASVTEAVGHTVDAVVRTRTLLSDPTSFTLLSAFVVLTPDKNKWGSDFVIGWYHYVASNGLGSKTQLWGHFELDKKGKKIGQFYDNSVELRSPLDWYAAKQRKGKWKVVDVTDKVQERLLSSPIR